MHFFIYPLFLIPIALWASCVAIILYFETKMVREVLHDSQMSRVAKTLWCVAMVPLLPLTAAVYYITKNMHHSQHFIY